MDVLLFFANYYCSCPLFPWSSFFFFFLITSLTPCLVFTWLACFYSSFLLLIFIFRCFLVVSVKVVDWLYLLNWFFDLLLLFAKRYCLLDHFLIFLFFFQFKLTSIHISTHLFIFFSFLPFISAIISLIWPPLWVPSLVSSSTLSFNGLVADRVEITWSYKINSSKHWNVNKISLSFGW